MIVEKQTCQLCLQENKLCDSHIIPEFFFRPIARTSPKYRFLHISTDPTKKNVIRQKGFYEKLLCQECEGKFSRNELYAKDVLTGKAPIIIQKIGKVIFYSGVDYKRFKLFQLSLLWRAGVSKLSEFNGVSLGPHQENLRKMLYNENPGISYEYGCYLIADSNYSEILPLKIILPVLHEKRVEGYRVFRFVLAGLLWCFVVSGNNSQFPGKELFLSEKGLLVIGIDDTLTTQFFDQQFKKFSDAYKQKQKPFKNI